MDGAAPPAPPAASGSAAPATDQPAPALDPSSGYPEPARFEAKASRGYGGASTTATIEYTLPKPGHVRIVVFDVAGREVGRVVDGWRPEGQHVAEFSVGGGRRLASLYRIEWAGQSLSGKIELSP